MKKDVTRTNVLVKADILWAYPETGQGVLVKRMWDRCRTDEYGTKALWKVYELNRFGE